MEILKYPDPRLMAPNAPIEIYGPEERAKVAEMFRIMSGADGIGLAAPQVGWNVRLFIMRFLEVPAEEGETERTLSFVFFNPSIKLLGERILAPEGCLSFPGVFAKVERSSQVRLVAQTPYSNVDSVARGLPAQAIQHEMDHLDGVLFTDRMSAAERSRIEPLLEDLRKNFRKD